MGGAGCSGPGLQEEGHLGLGPLPGHWPPAGRREKPGFLWGDQSAAHLLSPPQWWEGLPGHQSSLREHGLRPRSLGAADGHVLLTQPKAKGFEQEHSPSSQSHALSLPPSRQVTGQVSLLLLHNKLP